MDMILTIDSLTATGVSIQKQDYVTIDGRDVPVGQPHRTSYINSAVGRSILMDELAEPYRSAVLAVWGPEPTVQEPPADDLAPHT